MPYKDPEKRKEWKRLYYQRTKYGVDNKLKPPVYPEIKIPENIKETKYPGYYISEEGKPYRAPGRYDRNAPLNEYGLIELNTHLRGNPRGKKYQYPSINISIKDENGKFVRQVKANIHNLVAETFIPNPHGYNSVEHKNRNKHDNHVSNLMWMDLDENKKSWERDDNYKEAQRIAQQRRRNHE